MFIVLHLPRERPSLLVDIFAPRCALPVREAEDKEPVAAGHRLFRAARLPPADRPRAAARAVEPTTSVNFSRPSIDVLFESAADVYGPRLLGIILTGASQRWRAGLGGGSTRAGGVTVVQRPDEPRARRSWSTSALKRGPADLVLSLDEIADLLADRSDPAVAAPTTRLMSTPIAAVTVKCLLVDDLEENLLALVRRCCAARTWSC